LLEHEQKQNKSNLGFMCIKNGGCTFFFLKEGW